jgi:hypothetical protein
VLAGAEGGAGFDQDVVDGGRGVARHVAAMHVETAGEDRRQVFLRLRHPVSIAQALRRAVELEAARPIGHVWLGVEQRLDAPAPAVLLDAEASDRQRLRLQHDLRLDGQRLTIDVGGKLP